MGTGVAPLKVKAEKHQIKVRDVDLFIVCCHQRFIYDLRGATSDEWRELAAKYQQAKGAGKVSYMAEYCLRKAGMAI